MLYFSAEIYVKMEKESSGNWEPWKSVIIQMDKGGEAVKERG